MASPKYQKDSFERKSLWRGLKLHVTKWEPQSPRALLYISHGVGEHMGRYEQLADVLATNGIFVFGHDHVGHGRSEGDRVHIEDYQQYVQDVIQTVKYLTKQHPDLPCFLMGHSMGGLIAGLTAAECQGLFKGLILSAALVEIDPKAAGWFVQNVVKVVALVAPQLGIKKISITEISSIPEEVQLYLDDPLVYQGSMKAGWGAATTKAISKFRQSVEHIQLPLLIIHGTDDNLVPISGSEYVAQTAHSSHLRFEKFNCSKHEVFHDVDQARARDTVFEWILSIDS